MPMSVSIDITHIMLVKELLGTGNVAKIWADDHSSYLWF